MFDSRYDCHSFSYSPKGGLKVFRLSDTQNYQHGSQLQTVFVVIVPDGSVSCRSDGECVSYSSQYLVDGDCQVCLLLQCIDVTGCTRLLA
jgi:hypothetical protein